MMDSEIIYSSIVYRKEMALKLAVFSGISLLLLFVSNYFLKNIFLSLLFLILSIAPLFFINVLIKKFTSKVVFDFREKIFSISIINSSGKDEKCKEYYLDEILSFSIQHPNWRFSSIKLKFKNGKSVEYSFLQQKLANGQVTIEILKRFYSLIKNYNRSEYTINKILFKPSFFASQKGLFCIGGLCILFFIAVGLHILYQVKSLPFTLFFGFSLIMQLILKRKSDINIYKKLDKSYVI